MKQFEQLRDEAVRPLLTEVGACVYASQSLEYAIAYLIYLLSKEGSIDFPTDTAQKILDNEDKKTIGQLIGLLHKHAQADEESSEFLSRALSARNTVIHRYLIENGERIAEPGERQLMFKELRDFRNEIVAATKILDPAVKELALRVDGFSVEDYQELLQSKFVDLQIHEA